jgi:hypothetical protein
MKVKSFLFPEFWLTMSFTYSLYDDLHSFWVDFCRDEISTKFLKEMAAPVTPALTLIFQASLNQGQTPDDWKLVPRFVMFEVLSIENTDENCEFSSLALVFGSPCKFPFSFRGAIPEFSQTCTI